jgi:hypothetical protein
VRQVRQGKVGEGMTGYTDMIKKEDYIRVNKG